MPQLRPMLLLSSGSVAHIIVQLLGNVLSVFVLLLSISLENNKSQEDLSINTD